jgi:adenylate cyclase
VLCWGAGFLWILSQPATITSYDIPGYDNLPVLKRVELSNQVTFVNLSARIQEFFLMLVFAGTLAAGVWRSRRLLQRQVVAERARTNLSRYFSPAIVDEILNEDMGVTEGRTQKAAVLFADIVGFTRLSEKLPPADVMTLLREFHGRMGAAIFDHKGTIDKYIGDEVMATFGTPIAGPDDAANAIACARTMRGALADWNRDRAETGAPPVDVGIGVDFGDVVIGNMGDERRLEFAVIGDTVNVASRLQSLTRESEAAVLVSGDVVEAAGTPTGLMQIGATAIRGREGEVSLWTVS